MSDHGIDAAISERRHETERVAHQVEQAERVEVVVVNRVPARGAAIAALVRRDDVKACIRKSRHHLAPGEGELGKAVQQQHARPPTSLKAGFEHMHAQAVDAIHVTRADRGRQGD
jgi:hypothetical protein